MTEQAQLLPGTLDLLILAPSLWALCMAMACCCALGKFPEARCSIEQGALYPGLFRLVRQGLLKSSWGTSENNRRAKFYELTAAGRKRLREETEGWNRLAAAMAFAFWRRNRRKYEALRLISDPFANCSWDDLADDMEEELALAHRTSRRRSGAIGHESCRRRTAGAH